MAHGAHFPNKLINPNNLLVANDLQSTDNLVNTNIETNPVEEKKKILSDLGRPTKRGIKKCFKCGIYNGTRGFTCKNKQCDAVLRDVEKRKVNLDAVKLVGTSKQVFSVRVRDKGPDFRGFVQLPLVYTKSDGAEEKSSMAESGGFSNDVMGITEVAICFVESCQRLFDDSILKCHEMEVGQNCCSGTCMHIDSAFKSSHVATSLKFKPDVLNLTGISEEFKQKLWDLGKKTDGMIVQRVSKSVMVVKCQVTPKNPLGYLHLAYFVSKGKDVFDKYVCGCAEYKGRSYSEYTVRSYTDEPDEPSCCDSKCSQKCLHYYACIASFAGDPKCAEEFKFFVNMELETANMEEDDHLVTEMLGMYSRIEDGEKSEENNEGNYLGSTAFLSNDCSFIGKEVRLPGQARAEKNSGCQGQEVAMFKDGVFKDGVFKGGVFKDGIFKDGVFKNGLYKNGLFRDGVFKDRVFRYGLNFDSNYQDSYQYMTALDSLATSRVNLEKTYNCAKNVKPKKGKRGYQDEDVISFTDWLSSITECINETLYYSGNEDPDALVFHIPLRFFELLRERLSSSNSKMRLPNSTEKYMRQNKSPVGNLYKYTWHITNILHAKQMFDTTDVSLEFIKHFIKNKNGDFIEYDGNKIDDGSHIKPPRYTAYLKVGFVTKEQKEPIPFVIEWIPNFLRVSNFGELTLRYKIGYQRNYL